MITKDIIYFGQPMTMACDGNCAKAWGINGRPRNYYQDPEVEPDDYVHLSDSALGTAPGPGRTVGLSEGGDMKPHALRLADGARMNKWCARECERSEMVERGAPITLPDMERPTPNCPYLHAPDKEPAK